jgi:hypothetical protein
MIKITFKKYVAISKTKFNFENYLKPNYGIFADY